MQNSVRGGLFLGTILGMPAECGLFEKKQYKKPATYIRLLSLRFSKNIFIFVLITNNKNIFKNQTQK